MQTIRAVNPFAGLSPNERKRIMNNLNSNSNSNTNSRRNSTSNSLSLFRNTTRKNKSPKQPIFARNPYPGMSNSNFNSNSNVEEVEVEVKEEEKPLVEPYKPSAVGIAFKQAVLNRIKQKEAEEALEKFRANQRKKYVSKYKPVFAVSPTASPATKAYIQQLKKNYQQRTQANKPKKQVSFSANTKQRKSRKLRKSRRNQRS